MVRVNIWGFNRDEGAGYWCSDGLRGLLLLLYASPADFFFPFCFQGYPLARPHGLCIYRVFT